MKHVSFGEKTLLMGDDIAQALVEYARILGNESRADTVTAKGIGPDGNTVDITFLLNAATTLVIESTDSDIEPPENDEAVRYVNDSIERIQRPPTARTGSPFGDGLSDLDPFN